MLLELRIRNFAIIEQAELEFGPGLNVLSGETGAGKTIIMNALAILLGGRSSSDVVRVDQKEAVVEARFELEGDTLAAPAATGAEGREVLIRRSVAEGGRSRALVNDELATVASLAKIGSGLVEIYGQHEQQTLLRPESHQQNLDRFAGLEPRLGEYRAAYERALVLRARLDELARREHERADLLELARFKVAELDRAALRAGEDEELVAERTVLANATRLAAAAHEAHEALYGGEGAAVESIARAQARLAEAAAIDSRLKEPHESIAAARAGLEDAALALRAYADRAEADPARLEHVDNRLQELNRLKRKYGGSIPAAIEALEAARAEIAALEGVAHDRASAERELADALAGLAASASDLSALRRHAAAELKRKMEAELKTLGMRSPVFEAQLAPLGQSDAGLVHDGAALGPSGLDTVEFYLSPNLGQPPMPLARIASGGELSRVMLALKTLEARRRGTATMIFDEVDAGIGGGVAEVVGRKLKFLARYHQILCITHLPQIAAFADRHFLVEKEERRGATRSRVTMLGADQRAEEIARMLGGAEITNRFRRAARELLDRAQA
jgi:DNA repair protein RecN (Recombination protein N)